MENAPYGYCGMPCALCTRFRTEGKSRCAGCSAGGYYTDVCKVYACCRARGLAHCGLCADFPCARLGKMGDFRDLNTGGVKMRTCAAIADGGFQSWYARYADKTDLLARALREYNNGRMKRFLCELFIRQNIETLRALMEKAQTLSCAPEEKPAAFRRLARELCGEEQA